MKYPSPFAELLNNDDGRKKLKKMKRLKKEEKKDNKKDKKKKEHTEKVKHLEKEVTALDRNASHMNLKRKRDSPPTMVLPFDHKYVLAPMVGASELAFRLLCRRYGTQLAYTPMMSSSKFARDPNYRKEIFQTTLEDRPLVAHFSANDPDEFAQAAALVENDCDAVDLNLGCPQRTAFVGHFGSYLLGAKDRDLLVRIVRRASESVSVPIFVKIRLLNTLEETIELCQQLSEAGASLIAVHARYRASFERKGAGARDGAALLEQVKAIKVALPNIIVISNGNVITYAHVMNNLDFTGADGIMSAEGILDNPALFSPSLNETKGTKKKRKLMKKMRIIKEIEQKIATDGQNSISTKEKEKLSKKNELQQSFETLEKVDQQGTSKDNTALAEEYLSLAESHPVKIRSIIFHIRRMCRDILNEFQLMEDCLLSTSIKDVRSVMEKCKHYRKNPESFRFDHKKAQQKKALQELIKNQEKKRKNFEDRMKRKAKREGKLDDLEFYLRKGAEVPTVEKVESLKLLSKEARMEEWKKSHAQHCVAFHIDEDGCKRDRACAFLHVEAKGLNAFHESEEVAG